MEQLIKPIPFTQKKKKKLIKPILNQVKREKEKLL